MRKIIKMFLFTIIASPFVATPKLFAEDKRIAVLEFQNRAKMKQDDVSYLAELFRGIAVPLRSKGYIIMTKENMISLLPPNKKLEQCVGECEVETGRKLGAHYIVAGVVYKIDEGFKLLVKLYETKGGSLVSSSEYDGQSAGDIAKKVKGDTASDIFKPLLTQGVIAGDRAFGKSSQEAWDPGIQETTVVEFSSTPKNAQVIIDDIPKCNTPCSEDLSLGRHALSMSIPRYLPYQEEIDVKKGMAKIERKLEINFGYINVTSKPVGLTVYLDQKSIGKTPLTSTVDPGKHVVTVKSNQYFEKGMEFTLKKGEEKAISLEPTAKVGALDIKAFDSKENALKAEVLIDKKSVGETPLVIKNFIIGKHSIVVKKDGFIDDKQDIILEEKKVYQHKVRLTKGETVSEAYDKLFNSLFLGIGLVDYGRYVYDPPGSVSIVTGTRLSFPVSLEKMFFGIFGIHIRAQRDSLQLDKPWNSLTKQQKKTVTPQPHHCDTSGSTVTSKDEKKAVSLCDVSVGSANGNTYFVGIPFYSDFLGELVIKTLWPKLTSDGGNLYAGGDAKSTGGEGVFALFAAPEYVKSQFQYKPPEKGLTLFDKTTSDGQGVGLRVGVMLWTKSFFYRGALGYYEYYKDNSPLGKSSFFVVSLLEVGLVFGPR